MQDRIAIHPQGEGPEAVATIVERARRRGFTRFVVPAGTAMSPAPTEEVAEREGAVLRLPGTEERVEVRTVRDLAGLDAALAGTPDGGLLAIEWRGDRIIPLEWAVARRGRRFRLWNFAASPREVPAALGALEHGADRVVVTVQRPEEVDELESLLEHPLSAPLGWRVATVRTVAPAGLGDRIIVDTTSLLAAEEGLLVGSAAAFLFHIASEAVGSDFSRPRPFRVNAGAAHSYVLMADGSTRYLSELSAGDAVLAVAPGAVGRAVRVGRIKIERRPLSLVRAEEGEHSRTVFLQEAETVRLSAEGGRVAVPELRIGTSVWGVSLPAARHLGVEVEETIEER